MDRVVAGPPRQDVCTVDSKGCTARIRIGFDHRYSCYPGTTNYCMISITSSHPGAPLKGSKP